MPSTKNMKLDPTKLLFVGPNGRGKTRAWASIHKILPPGSKIYCFDFDGRMAPIRSFYPEADIEYDTYGPNNFAQARQRLLALSKLPRYQAVIVDSITAVSMSAINYQLEVKGTSGKGELINSGGLPVSSWEDINGETILISQMMDVMKAYPGIWVCTAHPVTKTETIEQKTTRTKELLGYGPKIGSLVPNYFNEIYSFHKEVSADINAKPNYYVRTNDEIGKTALNLPNVIKWNDGDFFPILHEELKKLNVDITKDLPKSE